MTARPPLFQRLMANDALNFALTNRIPRAALTRLFGRFSKVEHPWVRDLSIGLWQRFGEVDLSDARKTQFRSLHDAFIRELRDGARPLDPRPDVLVSPCDAIVGALGRIEGDTLLQAKGMRYTLDELLGDSAQAAALRDGHYMTLRITAAMYHRFHAPADCTIERVHYFPGDTWNVNPPALARVERLYCRNERAVLSARMANGTPLVMVPVAAILVASLRLHCVDLTLHAGYAGPHRLACAAHATRGQELGWFEHGSTILLLLPPQAAVQPAVTTGERIRMGQALFTPAPL
ncbi:archaetidylserine decarboxylase [Methyloversatilis universalis]|uniref:archaetidylserine decarboxylase n=1 Tax=Methyloversatilis universalis TaxID=378211 RepID=UPI00037F5305|nr:archaetidylserine decarboxylase [Methyloversatilis universalis]